MATYKGIQGYSVQVLASDPSPTASVTGQLWYNSTSGTYKISTQTTGAWSAGGLLNTYREEGGGAGIQSAGICAGGLQGPTISPRYRDETEIYDGTTWTEVNDLNTGRATPDGAGSTTAALWFGGGAPGATSPPANTESWNGTAWTAVSGLATARRDASGWGTQALASCAGGVPTRTNYEEWNGSAWSAATAFNTGRSHLTGVGTQTAGLIFGGNQTPLPTQSDLTEIWNGSTWTEVNDLTTARQFGAGSGITTAAVYFGGTTGSNSALTELYDGTSWTEVGDMGLARRALCGATGAPSGVSMAYGGFATSYPQANQTEEWNDPVIAIKTVTTS